MQKEQKGAEAAAGCLAISASDGPNLSNGSNGGCLDQFAQDNERDHFETFDHSKVFIERSR
jgi:hypothetical protein